jgi:hypothetical protein
MTFGTQWHGSKKQEEEMKKKGTGGDHTALMPLAGGCFGVGF